MLLVIFPFGILEEIGVNKIEESGASVPAIGNGGTHLVAGFPVSAFTASVAAVCSVRPAVFFVVVVEADTGTTSAFGCEVTVSVPVALAIVVVGTGRLFLDLYGQ